MRVFSHKIGQFGKWLLGEWPRLALVSLLLVASDQVAISWMGLADKFPRSLPRHWFQVFFVLLLLRLVFSRAIFAVWAYVFLFFSFLQWLSLAYYGSFLSPMMIYLFFREIGEVVETFKGVLPMLLKPTFVAISGAVLMRGLLRPSNKIYLAKTEGDAYLTGLRRKILKGLIVFTLIYPIPRTFVTGHTFGKQAKVQELSFVNFYGAISYFLGRILPAKARASNSQPNVPHVPTILQPHPRRHVVLILGESLATNRMQMFGYARPTTPRLMQQKEQGQVLWRRGISGGVSTDVSIPMLLHGVNGNEASATIASQARCLFKLAKANGFETSFLSVQTQENLQHISNYFCSTYLDHFKVGDNERTVDGESTIMDEELIDYLRTVDWKNPQFILLHQRGSHSPYDKRYPPQDVSFVINKNDSWEAQQIDHYDNSVRYTDKVIADLLVEIKSKSSLPVEIVFTSDHGEALGEDKNWGHVILYPLVAEVPVLYWPGTSGAPEISDKLERSGAQGNQGTQGVQGALNFRTTFAAQPEWVTHRFLATFIINLLGYALEPQDPQEAYMVMGADLDGLGGSMWVRPTSAGRLELVKEPGSH